MARRTQQQRAADEADDFDQMMQESIRTEAMQIISDEGYYHVEGQYYASLASAELMREVVAGRRVRERLRFAEWAEAHGEEIAA